MSVADLDFLLIMLFGFGFLHKWWVERSILVTSEKLTPKDGRSNLGNAFREKTRSLAWLMFCLGVVFLLRGVPNFDESRWLVFSIRLTAFGIFLWNQISCHRMRRALKEEVRRVHTGPNYLNERTEA